MLAGPNGDPASVGADAANNIAQAFADIATAGHSRQGHIRVARRNHHRVRDDGRGARIWALVASSGLQPASLVLCTVSAADGGGMTPIKSSVQSPRRGQRARTAARCSAADAPNWYAITGANQANNVIDTNNCTGFHSGPNSCYVLTDRGTFDYLVLGDRPRGRDPEPQDRHP